jgi:hypothetical protein
MDTAERQRILDEEHLRLLRIGYLTMGGVSAFTGLFGLFYVFMGAVMASAMRAAPKGPGEPPPELFAWFFAGMGLLFMVLAGSYAAMAFMSARALRLRRSRTLCLITAGLSCLYIPFGTLLGVFTFSVLGRQSVLTLFMAPPLPLPPLPTPPLPPRSGSVA